MTPYLVYITTESVDEARRIGRALIEANLAACVNIIDNMRSMYIWDGQVQDDAEVILIVKTTQAGVDQVISKVNALHSYECPCAIAWPIANGNPAFLSWIGEQVQV